MISAALVSSSLIIASCNKHATSERINSEIGKIDWRLDDSMKIHSHGSGTSGGTAASSSTLTLAADFIAPKGYILPEDSVSRLVSKLSNTIELAGGKVIHAGKDDDIHYTQHSDNFDHSAYIFKVVYEADGIVGYIGGVLVKRRYIDDTDPSLEIVGQILLSLHEER